MLVAEGFDKFNDDKETYVDLKVYEDVSLKTILEGIESSLLIQPNSTTNKNKDSIEESTSQTGQMRIKIN